MFPEQGKGLLSLSFDQCAETMKMRRFTSAVFHVRLHGVFFFVGQFITIDAVTDQRIPVRAVSAEVECQAFVINREGMSQTSILVAERKPEWVAACFASDDPHFAGWLRQSPCEPAG